MINVKNPYVIGVAAGGIALVAYLMSRNSGAADPVPISAIPYDRELALAGMQMSLERERMQSDERLGISQISAGRDVALGELDVTRVLGLSANATQMSIADVNAQTARLGITSARDVQLAALDTQLAVAREGNARDIALRDRDIIIQQGTNDAMVRTREIDANAEITRALYNRDATIAASQYNRDATIAASQYSYLSSKAAADAQVAAAKAGKTRSIGYGKFSLKW